MKNNKGFSLVELIVVIAIMAILVGVAVPVFSSYVEKSAKEKDIALVDEMADAIVLANNSGHLQFEVAGQYSEGLQIPVGYIVITDTKDADEKYVNVIGQGLDKSVLEQALIAKFGDNYATELSLAYDGWNGNMGAFFSKATSMVETVDKFGDTTLSFLGTLDKFNITVPVINKTIGVTVTDGVINIPKVTLSYPFYTTTPKRVMSEDYGSSEEMLLAVAKKVSGTDQTAFVDAWLNVSTHDQEGFAIKIDPNTEGKEYYSAVRAAYNYSFAGYVENDSKYTHDGEGKTKHITEIQGFGESALEFLGLEGDKDSDMKFPQTVCSDAFKTDFEDYDAYDFTKCSACSALYELYKNSTQAKSDATNFYNMMTTGANTDPAEYAEDGLFAWLKGEAASFEASSNEVNGYTNGKSAIVLTVYYKDGQIVVDFTPIDATP